MTPMPCFECLRFRDVLANQVVELCRAKAFEEYLAFSAEQEVDRSMVEFIEHLEEHHK